MLNLLTSEMFVPHIGTVFKLPLQDGGTIELRLDDVESLGPSPGVRPDGSTRRGPFSLFFAGPIEPILRQRIYHLDHPSFVGLDIFIVPLGPRGEAMRYQAIFN